MSKLNNKNPKIKRKQKTYKRDNCNKYSSNSNSQTSKLCCFGYVDYIVLASTLAIALGEELSSDDLAILASFFAVLSDELALITSIQDCGNDDDKSTFVPPIPDVALTSTKSSISKQKNKKKK